MSKPTPCEHPPSCHNEQGYHTCGGGPSRYHCPDAKPTPQTFEEMLKAFILICEKAWAVGPDGFYRLTEDLLTRHRRELAEARRFSGNFDVSTDAARVDHEVTCETCRIGIDCYQRLVSEAREQARRETLTKLRDAVEAVRLGCEEFERRARESK